MTPARCLLAALCCAAACCSVHAGRSSISDESDVAEAGDCETELVFDRATARSERPQRDRTLRLACGVGWGIEVEAAHSRQRSGTARGEALGLEVKTDLRERDENQVGWAVAAALGAERRGGSWRRSEYAFEVEATRLLGERWLVEAKLGVARDVRSRRDSTLWGLALEFAVNDDLELVAELEGNDRGRPLAKAGLRWTLWEDVQLKASYGQRSGSRRERETSIGLMIEF